jgi:uncharacterized protein (TIGR01777 family)
MKILITGSSGLVGSALIDHLANKGHQIGRLLRQANDDEPYWDIDKGHIDLVNFGEPDAIIHLAGENIAEGRWNMAKKQRILTSRVQSTQLLVDCVSKMQVKPKVFISGSAIGFYGNRGGEVMDEQSSHGHDFVSEVATKWEAASVGAQDYGVRVVNIRTGMVLSPKGGALGKMLLPFKMGLGGVIGNGRQYVSWINIDDMVRAIEFLLNHETVKGPVNLVSPIPVTNREYTKALGQVLSRPTIMAMPAFVARLAFGEMADELLLSSTRVMPVTLTKMGFSFNHESIENALSSLLKTSK